MHQILKIVGIPAEGIPDLHKVLAGSKVRGKLPVDSSYGDDRPTYAELLTAKLDSEHGTYTVEIKVQAVQETRLSSLGDDKVVLVPRSVILAIYDALGIYPEEEKYIIKRRGEPLSAALARRIQ